MNLDERLKRLERLASARARMLVEREQFCGVIPLIVRDGFIQSCVYIPCDHVPTWQEWGSLGRSKATCPDVETCGCADVCRAGEQFNSRNSQTEQAVLS